MSRLNLTNGSGDYLSIIRTFAFLLVFFSIPSFAQKKGGGGGSGDVIPVLECVEYLGNGKLAASFGYENLYKETVTVSQGNSTVLIGAFKSAATNTFKPGRQYAVFRKEFNEREVVVWTIILPNGKQKQVTASANSSLCRGTGTSTGNIFPYYPPPTSGKTTTTPGPELTSLYDRYTSDSSKVFSDDVYQIFDGYVLIEIAAEREYITQLRSTLATAEYGFKGEITNTAGSPLITGLYPIVNIPKLNSLDAMIRFVRPVYLPIANSGIVTSQGDKAQRTDVIRNGFRIDGKDVKVGIISDSYNTRIGNEAATDVLNGDLPSGVQIVREYPYGLRSDEGRAMMQIVHDVAPGADLAFRTGFLSPGDLALGIGELTDAGCDIIVDDITYITEPYFIDGPVATAVNAASNAGVSYFTSAGNFGSKSYQRIFNPTTAPAGFTGAAHNFGNGDVMQRIGLTEGVYTIVLQWEDQFYTVGSVGNGTQNDFDIFLTNESGVILFGFNRNNAGGDPVEVLPFTVVGGNAVANLIITRVSGTGSPLLKYVVYRGDLLIAEYNTSSGTIVGHANAAQAMTVGAVLYSNTPAFGVPAPTIASFSSTGGTPVNGVIRNKPDFAAPNGVNTTVPLGGVNIDGDAFPNFFGTSASAPHAAGAAALLLHARKKFYNEHFAPSATRSLLQSTALNMGPAGFDFNTGYGFIQPDAAIRTFASPSPLISKIIMPSGVTPGQLMFNVVIEGEFLTTRSVVYLKGKPLPSRLLNSRQVEATVPVFAGNPAVQVYNPPITPSGLDGGLSNSLYFFPKTVITIKADDASKTYGSALPSFTATITGLPSNSTLSAVGIGGISFASPATSISNVGNYIIRPFASFTDSTKAEFFDVNLVNGVLSVTPLDLIVEPDDLSIVYGSKIPEITFQYHYNDSLVIDKQLILDSLKSTHQALINKGVVALVTNKSVTNATGTIGGKALVNKSFLATSNTISGGKALVNGTVIINVDAASLLDTTAITNGTATIVNGTGMIGGKALVNGFGTIGGKALVNGTGGKALVNGETVNDENNSGMIVVVSEADSLISNLFAVNLITDTLVGNHFIVPASLLTKNFNVSYAPGDLTISPASLTVTADDKTIKAGDPLPVFTSSVTGFVNRESAATVLEKPITYTVNPSYMGAAGSYSIIPSITLKEPANYSSIVNNGKLYVNPYGTGAKAVRPFLYCVEELAEPVEGFFYVARFGYKNMNSVPVSVSPGSDNYFMAEGSFIGTPPSLFPPGEGTFSIYFDGSRLSWILKTTENTRKTSMVSVASASSNRCNRYEKIYGINVEALYPNPVSDFFKVLLNDIPQSTSVNALNEQTGKSHTLKISQGTYANELNVNVQNLSAGFYTLRIFANNKAFTYRIVKQ
jgi:hypothetical protein